MGSVGQPCMSLEDTSAESNIDYGGPAQEGLEGISTWARDYAYDTLANNVAASPLCPKDLLGAKLKNNRLIGGMDFRTV